MGIISILFFFFGKVLPHPFSVTSRPHGPLQIIPSQHHLLPSDSNVTIYTFIYVASGHTSDYVSDPEMIIRTSQERQRSRQQEERARSKSRTRNFHRTISVEELEQQVPISCPTQHSCKADRSDPWYQRVYTIREQLWFSGKPIALWAK